MILEERVKRLEVLMGAYITTELHNLKTDWSLQRQAGQRTDEIERRIEVLVKLKAELGVEE